MATEEIFYKQVVVRDTTYEHTDGLIYPITYNIWFDDDCVTVAASTTVLHRTWGNLDVRDAIKADMDAKYLPKAERGEYYTDLRDAAIERYENEITADNEELTYLRKQVREFEEYLADDMKALESAKALPKTFPGKD